jgi:hypothetical protein
MLTALPARRSREFHITAHLLLTVITASALDYTINNERGQLLKSQTTFSADSSRDAACQLISLDLQCF